MTTLTDSCVPTEPQREQLIIKEATPVVIGSELQKLGEYLANKLDEDDFNAIVGYLDSANEELAKARAELIAKQSAPIKNEVIGYAAPRYALDGKGEFFLVHRHFNEIKGWTLPITVASTAQTKQSQSEAVGEALESPVDKDYTIATFNAEVVPAGTKLYTTPPNHTEALAVAKEALEFECGNRCNAEYNPCSARQALDKIKELGV